MRGEGLRYFSKEVENLSKRRTGVIIAGLIHDKESGNWRYRDPIKKTPVLSGTGVFSFMQLSFLSVRSQNTICIFERVLISVSFYFSLYDIRINHM